MSRRQTVIVVVCHNAVSWSGDSLKERFTFCNWRSSLPPLTASRMMGCRETSNHEGRYFKTWSYNVHCSAATMVAMKLNRARGLIN